MAEPGRLADALVDLYTITLRHEDVIWRFKDEDEVWHNAFELGVNMLTSYKEHYGKDSEWKVIATELPFHTIVYSPKTHEPLFVYVGVVDGVWERRTDKTIWVVDHKTTRDDPTKKAAALMLDEQAGAYWTVGVDALRAQGKIKPGQELNGMLYNFLRKGKADERPKNAAGQSLNKDGTVDEKDGKGQQQQHHQHAWQRRDFALLNGLLHGVLPEQLACRLSPGRRAERGLLRTLPCHDCLADAARPMGESGFSAAARAKACCAPASSPAARSARP